MVSDFQIAVPIMNHSTMKELRHAKKLNFGPVAENDPQNVIDLDLVAENAKVIDPREQIKNEKQKFCMCLMNSKADSDDELLLNMSDAFFSEMKIVEGKKFKQVSEWRELYNLLGKKVVLVRVLVFNLRLFPNIEFLEQLLKWVPLF